MDDLAALFAALDDTPIVRENYIRAPFGYPGSKADSLDKILPHLSYRKIYCEPFGGTGSVLLSRNESPLEIFNDRYAGVVSFYRCLRDYSKMQKLVDWIEAILHSREEFIWCRDTWKNCEDDIERAGRWYYMTIMSFGSQGRNFGRSTSGSASISKKLANSVKRFHPIHNRIRNVQIENLDWRDCFKDFDSLETVWYLDPTYYHYAKGCYEHEMSKTDHHEMLERIQNLQGFVALSGYDNPVYDKYPWDAKYSWTVFSTALAQAFTDTNNLKDKQDIMKRGTVKEVLWIREAKD